MSNFLRYMLIREKTGNMKGIEHIFSEYIFSLRAPLSCIDVGGVIYTKSHKFKPRPKGVSNLHKVPAHQGLIIRTGFLSIY